MTNFLPEYSELQLETRRHNQIENETDRRAIRVGDEWMSQKYKEKYPDAVHRPTSPSRRYNCHGLTFTSRRTWIHKASEIAKLLKDDDYETIDLGEIMPGDVIVYYENGDAEHSGLILATQPAPLVLSKWGPTHEVIHKINDCPYDSMEKRFYRIRI